MSQPGARAQAVEAAKQLAGSHYECEDSWYSCPKSAEGCANSGQGDECTCGYDNRVTAIAQAIQAAVAAERERCAKVADGMAEKCQNNKWNVHVDDCFEFRAEKIANDIAQAIRQEGEPS